LQVRGLVASIVASMEVLDLITWRNLAEVRNDLEERLASGNSTGRSPDIRRKNPLDSASFVDLVAAD